MRLHLVKPDGAQYDVTDAVARVEWSGSASQAARQLSVDYLNAPFDAFDIPPVSTGDLISFWEGDTELFYGQFFGSERSAAIGTITFTAYDMMKNLLESSGQYNFKNLTPETIAAMVCADAQIPVRYLYPTGVNIASMLCDDMPLYDVIMAAYTKAHRTTGDKYYPVISGRGLCVYRTEWMVAGFALDDSDNLLSASVEETMEGIVNRVKIYDAAGAQVGEVNDAGSMSRFGTYQKIYTVEDGVEPTGAARNLLSTLPAQTVKVSAVGDTGCMSCRFVRVYDSATGLSGRYWISSDRHTWQNGAYTMELDLEFDSIMDIKESSEETS